jgi:hypothetical protein
MTDAYTDTEYSATMPAVLAERRGFVIRKMPLKFGTGGIKMTLVEAIKICEEDAEKIGDNPQPDRHAERCRQLAEWLRELVAYKKIRMCGNCRHYVRGTTHFGECHVMSDIKPCVVSVNQNACDTFFDYKDFDYKDFRNGV